MTTTTSTTTCYQQYHQKSKYNYYTSESTQALITKTPVSNKTIRNKLFNKTSCILFILILVVIRFVECQELPNNNSNNRTNSLDDGNKANISLSLSVANETTTSPELIISGEEFVDFTEAPILLIDGTLNDNTTTSTSTSTTSAPSTSISNEKFSNNNQTSVGETSTNAPATVSTTTTTTEEIVDDEGEPEGVEDENNNNNLNNKEEKEEEEQNSFEPPQNVSQYMDYIERLFHDLRHQITDLFEPHIPQLIRTSQMVQLTSSCSYDMLKLALALRQFEPWALKMIDSSGKVPEGIFEGSFTALGSYDECLSTSFAGSSSSSSSMTPTGSNQKVSTNSVTQGKYCLVNISPFMPPKPPADKVERMFQEEANRRNYTKDDQFSRLSPMFYYMKFRIGVCVPSTCVDSDLGSISSALSSSIRLNITIPHCKVRLGDVPLTKHQLAGGFVFGLVLLLVIFSTIMDCTRKKLNKISKLNKIVILTTSKQNSNEKQTTTTTTTTYSVPVTLSSNQQGFHHEDNNSDFTYHEKEDQSYFRKHWSWMSFSVLTNYKLYFEGKAFKLDKLLTTNGSQNNPTKTNHSTMMIECLNGIRVLSLCWVIIANSYITLDPRATKRLTKTREAPKDFLFQMIVQASLAIETFFFLSGVLMSLSFARKLKPTTSSSNDNNQKKNSYSVTTPPSGVEVKKEEKVEKRAKNTRNSDTIVNWVQFYVHRYIRMTPATMLVIAFTMFAFRYGDGPLWIETTHKAHSSCSENWWRHLLHIANFIDTRQMCFIHYWYIAADMQLFLFAPILMFLLYKYRSLGYTLISLIGFMSIGNIFYTTYMKNLPPTLLFYNSDPESRREFGNTIMTKPLTHALPYMVGMLVGKWLTTSACKSDHQSIKSSSDFNKLSSSGSKFINNSDGSLRTLLGLIALLVALSEVFLPYKWNNSYLPTRFLASLYAALFRLAWSLALAYLVISCRHKLSKKCLQNLSKKFNKSLILEAPQGASNTKTTTTTSCCGCSLVEKEKQQIKEYQDAAKANLSLSSNRAHRNQNNARRNSNGAASDSMGPAWCFCGSSGNILNRFLSLKIFSHLSKLSFVAYLIHLPLMSVFIAQTRGLFAFSHALVIHLALSYLLMTFILSFILVHIIEFPFLTLERYLFENLFYREKINNLTSSTQHGQNQKQSYQSHRNSDERFYYENNASGNNRKQINHHHHHHHHSNRTGLEMWQMKRDEYKYSEARNNSVSKNNNYIVREISERL